MEKIILSLIICIFLISIVSAVPVCIDLDHPSAPTNLVLSGSVNNVQLIWNAAIDIPECSGIAYYKIYRDEVGIGITSFNTLNFTDDNVSYGTYIYRVSAVDKVNHEGPYVEGTITLTAPGGGSPGGGGGGGSGGGGGGSSGLYYEEPIQTLNLGINILQKGVSYIFSFYNEGHKIELTETGDDYVWITIYSEEQKIELKIGETKEVDLDNDGIPDVSFGLTSLSSAGKAGIEFKTIIKEGAEEIISEENGEETIGTTGITGRAIANLFSGPSSIGTIILSLLILAFVIYFFVYKDKKKTIIKNIKKRIKKK